MADGDLIQIEEHKVDGKPLGRHVEHDPKSRGFQAIELVREEGGAAQQDRLWHRSGLVFDQDKWFDKSDGKTKALGSCTGNATAGSVMTSPNHRSHVTLTEDDAVRIYELATQLDGFSGQYPPDDTGSSGVAALKAAKQLGLIGGYRWTFAYADALTVLSTVGPIIVGVNWYDSFDEPGRHGLVELSPNAQVRGGHEFEIAGIDWGRQQLRAINSWGHGWGDRGRFTIPFSVFERLLNEQGDVAMIDPTVPIAA